MTREGGDGKEWIKYLDEETNAYYWYSPDTGESKWDEENDLAPKSQYENEYEMKEKEEDNIEMTFPVGKKFQKKAVESDEEDNLSNDGYEDENDDNELLIASLVDQDLLYRTKRDITIYTYCFILHSIFIEAPLSLLEALIRCILLFISFIFFLFLYFLSILVMICFPSSSSSSPLTMLPCSWTSSSPLPPLLRVSLLCLYEFIFTFALGLSLSIPGCILLVYREFNGVDEWELHPIPSILGWIDPRRLGIITLGQGSTAKNSNFHRSPILSSTQEQEELMDSIKPPNFLLPIQYPTIFSLPFCFPREILLFLRSR